MPESTKGAIITDEKDFWVVSQRIGNAVYRLTAHKYEAAPLDERIQNTSAFTLPHIEVNQSLHTPNPVDIGSFCIFFRYNGEDRILHNHMNSNSDLRKAFGEGTRGIILSFGHRGNSVELMEAILAQLDDMGECFIDENDGDMEGYRPIQKAAA